MLRIKAPVTRPAFVSHRIFDVAGYGRQHPLSIGRVGPVMRICRALGWLDSGNYYECEPATQVQLAGFHTPEYLEALRRVSATGRATAQDLRNFALGGMENPVFPQLMERVAASVGGAVLAARLAPSRGIAFHPGGGTHHGRPNRASGFCYSNDPVFAVRELLASGLARVAYVDLDAHHGDGVEEALAHDDRCLCISIHEAGRWPGTGQVHGPNALNYPVPRNFGDSRFLALMQAEVLPALSHFVPEAVVLTCGADCLAGDPLSTMQLSNVALWDAIATILPTAPHAVVLGGGGYNPWTTVRYWTGLWGLLNGWRVPSRLPEEARQVLQSLTCDLVDEDDMNPDWLTTLADSSMTAEMPQCS